MTVERRQIQGHVELRTEGESRAIVGYAAVYNTEAVIAGMWRERNAPGAFRSVIGPTADVRALFNHDPNHVLGRTVANTLRLSEDEKGLRYEIDPPNTSYAHDLMESLRRGDITQSSYGFRVKRDEWTKPTRAGDLPLRTILEYEELQDVSPVTFPAFEDTTAEARQAATVAATMPEPVPDYSVLRAQLDVMTLD
jgi:uncharacterized protein